MPEQFKPNPDANKKSEAPRHDWEWDQPGVRVGDFGKEGLATSLPEKEPTTAGAETPSSKPGYTWMSDEPTDHKVRIGDFGADGLATSLPEEGDLNENIGSILPRKE